MGMFDGMQAVVTLNGESVTCEASAAAWEAAGAALVAKYPGCGEPTVELVSAPEPTAASVSEALFAQGVAAGLEPVVIVADASAVDGAEPVAVEVSPEQAKAWTDAIEQAVGSAPIEAEASAVEAKPVAVAASLIRPGILVSLKSTVAGGASYVRVDLAPEGEATEGAVVSEWKTRRTIEDAAEYARASKVRSLALSAIKRFCGRTAFGLLCPEDKEQELDAAIRQARAMADEHNATATFSRVHIYALKGHVASSDEEAARAIGEEVRVLIDDMSGAIGALGTVKVEDTLKAIRDAASRAQEMSAMLSPERAEKVGLAVEAARRAARVITKRIEKGGEEIAVVAADLQRGAIERARIAFLDFDVPAMPAGAALPAVDVQRFDGIDVVSAPEGSVQ